MPVYDRKGIEATRFTVYYTSKPFSLDKYLCLVVVHRTNLAYSKVPLVCLVIVDRGRSTAASRLNLLPSERTPRQILEVLVSHLATCIGVQVPGTPYSLHVLSKFSPNLINYNKRYRYREMRESTEIHNIMRIVQE